MAISYYAQYNTMNTTSFKYFDAINVHIISFVYVHLFDFKHFDEIYELGLAYTRQLLS